MAACAMMRGAGAAFSCRIVGGGPLRGPLGDRIRALGLEGRVEIAGPVPQERLIALMQEASVVTLPCVIGTSGDRDGLPTVMLEGMALGLPVVSTTVSGGPEIVDQGKTGLLVEPNDPAALAASQVASYTIDKGAERRRVHVFSNAVDLERFHPAIEAATTGLAPDAFTIGFAGSLKRWHGVEVLLDAFREVRARIPEARLLLVGDGPRRDGIEGFLAGAGLEDAAVLTGWVDHDRLPGLIAAMDVATAPNPPTEDFYFSPLKLYEYLAVGRPVIASRIGQIAEAVEDGTSGLLVTPGDAGALADALIRVHAEPELARRLAEGAAAGAKYSWAGTAEAIVALGRRLRRAT